MISIAPKLTDVGRNLLIRGIGGERITFTRFKIGNGKLGDTDQTTLTDVINPILEFPIASADASNEGYVELSGYFDSGDITSDFRWCELGIFAKGEDEVEQLYAYTNDDENAGVLKANSEDVVIEQSVSVIVAIGTAENVTALISPSALYAAKDDFDRHVNNQENPHHVTAEMIGLGNVSNVGTNDQVVTYETPTDEMLRALTPGETMQEAFKKIARAILNLIGHITDKTNPHGVTATQAGAAAKRHYHGAADINSGILGIARGGTGVGTADELRAFLGSGVVTGMYYGNNATKRQIELGFRPVAVLVVNGRGVVGDDVDGVCGGLCVGRYGLRSRTCNEQSHETTWSNTHTAMMINDTGFWVNYASGYKVATNKSGESYRYIAWR